MRPILLRLSYFCVTVSSERIEGETANPATAIPRNSKRCIEGHPVKVTCTMTCYTNKLRCQMPATISFQSVTSKSVAGKSFWLVVNARAVRRDRPDLDNLDPLLFL